MLRRSLDHWFSDQGIRVRVIGEFQDSALAKTFGSLGTGLFIAPTVVEKDVRRLYNVAVVGRIPEVQERFYAVSVERRFKNPAVAAILEFARHKLFLNSSAADADAAALADEEEDAA